MGTANTGIFCCGECFWQSWPIVDSPKHGLWWYTPNFSMFKNPLFLLKHKWFMVDFQFFPSFPDQIRRFFVLKSPSLATTARKVPPLHHQGRGSRRPWVVSLAVLVQKNIQGTGPSVFSCHFPIQLVYLPPGWWLINVVNRLLIMVHIWLLYG